MSARIIITNTARATIGETWTFTVPDCFTVADGTKPESLFDVLMHAEGVERDCADEVIGDEETRADFRIVEMGATPLSRAAADVAALRADVWDDVGPALTCREVEVLADLFREAGAGNTARALILGHARGDDEDDQHYGLEA